MFCFDKKFTSCFVETKFIRNLIVVLHTVEIFVMNDSVSLIGCSGPDPNMELQSEEEIDVDKFFNPGTPEINFVGNFEKELMCLGKLLKCTLKFIPFKNWRQVTIFPAISCLLISSIFQVLFVMLLYIHVFSWPDERYECHNSDFIRLS